jgi:hypothetical protein
MSTGAEMGAPRPAADFRQPAQSIDRASFKDRFQQALLEVRQEEVERKALLAMPPMTDSSAWASAVRARRLRESLSAAGLNASVRSLARLLGWSSSRVGDLLKISDAFPQSVADGIGLGREREDEDLCEFSERGTRRLSTLSFRTLRSLTRLAVPKRIREARRLSQAPRRNARRSNQNQCTSG